MNAMKSMKAIQVALVNSSSLSDDDVEDGMRALQRQVTDDFGPVWHMEAELVLVGREHARAPVPCKHRQGSEGCPSRWGLVLLDDEPEDPRLRGYHDVTSHGLPLAKVLVGRIPTGHDWTHTASHELLEMLADPDCNAAVYYHPDALTSRIYAQEVCDPCGAYDEGYDVCGRRVSNFVWPSWFQQQSARRQVTTFDERNLIARPFELRPGGYIGVFDPATSTWKVLGADGVVTQGSEAEIDEPREVGSRLERRTTPENRWTFSDMSLSP